MNSWHSHPKIYNLGHREIANLLTVDVNVEEKIDGSQFSFGVTEEGELKVRSKGAQLHVDAPEAMFTKAVETAKALVPILRSGWMYRGEYLRGPSHNSLKYDRVPAKHIIIFDICTGEEGYLSYSEKAHEAERISLETVPLLFSGKIDTIDQFRQFLDRDSILGGQKIEGVVVKPASYSLYGTDKKCLMGKFVSESFKEVHAKAWKESNPTNGDILQVLSEQYRSMARWNKAVIHLREKGQITDTPRDIVALMKEVPADIFEECESEIKDALFKWAFPHIKRRCTAGLPEWWKEELLKRQFETPEEAA